MERMSSSVTELTLHLADRSLTPLYSSPNPSSTSNSRSQAQRRAHALLSLTANAITVYESASQLGMGLPQRVMVETQSGGPIVLHTFLSPQSQRPQPQRIISQDDAQEDIIEQARNGLRQLNGNGGFNSGGEALVNGEISGGFLEGQFDEQATVAAPPLLIASVVASSSTDMTEARRAAARLERLGLVFQREWNREQEGARPTVNSIEVEDG